MKRALIILASLLAMVVGRAETWADFTDCMFALGNDVPAGISIESDSLLRDSEIFYIGKPTVYPDSMSGPFLWNNGGRHVSGVYVIDNYTAGVISFYMKLGEEEFSDPIMMIFAGWDPGTRTLTAQSPSGDVTLFHLVAKNVSEGSE